MKKVAVLQSNYIPWKGYFDIINDVDTFVFYDEVQYTKNDWRNRNQIKTANGLKWLTLPCGYDLTRKIYEVEIKNEIRWAKDHYNLMCQNYRKSPFFDRYKDFLSHVYLEKTWKYLYELNRYIITTISQDFLGIKTTFVDSREFETSGQKHEKLLNLVKANLGESGGIYVSGPAAKDYIAEKDYTDAGIEIVWKDYSGYPEYPQPHGDFCHSVSVFDLLFNTGEEAPHYIWGWRKNTNHGEVT